jgi:DNA helicase HerA-like ATPase
VIRRAAASETIGPLWFGFREGRLAPSRDLVRDFSGRLLQALRAAHGLDTEIRILWQTGGVSPVRLTASGEQARTWVRSQLIPAYPMGQWLPLERETTEAAPLESWPGVRAGAAGAPLAGGVDPAPWCQAVIGGLAGLPAGLRVEWRCRPHAVPPGLSAQALHARDPAPHSVAAPLSAGRRALLDRFEARRWEPRWWIDSAVLRDRARVAPAHLAALARLVSTASARDGGGRISFRPGGWRRRWACGAIDMAESEVMGLLPAPWASVPVHARAPSPGEVPLWLGRNLHERPVGIPTDRHSGRHLLVLGETGMGKSSLLVRLAWQALRQGTMAFFDPIGDTAREFLAGVPPGRRPDVRWISPVESPRSINALANLGAEAARSSAQRERTLGDLVMALRRVRAGRYVDSSYWGPRIEEMLTWALRSAADWPGGTLETAERLLRADPAGIRGVPDVARPSVAELRERVETRPEDGEGARRLLREITRNELLEHLLCAAAPDWKAGDALVPGRITVISGDATQVGEGTARYLLAVHLALLWAEILARAERAKIFVLLDEAQWYAHDSVAEMLRLGRRFNVHLWLSTQALRSLSEGVRDAVVTNSADVVLFRGSPDEARDFSRWVPEIAAERLLRLPRGTAAALVGKGEAVDWIRTRAVPPLPPWLPEFRPPTDPGGDGSAPGVDEGAAGPGGAATSASPGTARGAELAAPVRNALRERLRSHDPGALVLTVSLPALRASLGDGPGGRARELTRDAGRILRAAGALRRIDRSPGATRWVLDALRLRSLVAADEPPGPGSRGADGDPSDPRENAESYRQA